MALLAQPETAKWQRGGVQLDTETNQMNFWLDWGITVDGVYQVVRTESGFVDVSPDSNPFTKEMLNTQIGALYLAVGLTPPTP